MARPFIADLSDRLEAIRTTRRELATAGRDLCADVGGAVADPATIGQLLDRARRVSELNQKTLAELAMLERDLARYLGGVAGKDQ